MYRSITQIRIELRNHVSLSLSFCFSLGHSHALSHTLSRSLARSFTMSKYQAGPKTLAIPMALYKKNRLRLVEELKILGTIHNKKEYSRLGAVPSNALVMLQGGKQECRHDTDHENLFRQVCRMRAWTCRKEAEMCP